jgi:hypothetical protein
MKCSFQELNIEEFWMWSFMMVWNVGCFWDSKIMKLNCIMQKKKILSWSFTLEVLGLSKHHESIENYMNNCLNIMN